jgi:pimeloyl-ACP methyl ester carboxylesterase
VVEGDHDDSITLVLTPVEPLRPQTRYGVAVTTRVRDAAGLCVAPAFRLQQALEGRSEDPRLQRLSGRLDGLVEALARAGTITGPADLSAALVFTTQSTYDTSAAVAEQIRATTYEYQAGGACVGSAVYRECEGTVEVDDFRVDGRVVDDDDPAPQRRYTLAVTTWLPTSGTGPYPTLIFGHGLGGDRHQASRLAEYAAPLGVATVAIDAVKHGDHPDQPESAEPLIAMADFFGISIDFDPPLDGIALRDNFRQSAYDKLQLLEALRPGVDVDGDGATDLSLDQLGYLGVSLGGLMAAEFLAFAPEAGVALIIVPGARVGSIIEHGSLMSIIVDVMRGTANDGQVARFFPMLQGIIDRGDPGAYTRYIVAERLPGFDGDTPQVLMQMVLDDDTVPNVSNLAFAQGLGVPLVGDALLPIPGLAHEPALPVEANTSAGVTAGVFQLDVIPDGNGGLETATHSNVADSDVALDQSLHFLQTYLDTGTAVLVDPYRRLGIKP